MSKVLIFEKGKNVGVKDLYSYSDSVAVPCIDLTKQNIKSWNGTTLEFVVQQDLLEIRCVSIESPQNSLALKELTQRFQKLYDLKTINKKDLMLYGEALTNTEEEPDLYKLLTLHTEQMCMKKAVTKMVDQGFNFLYDTICLTPNTFATLSNGWNVYWCLEKDYKFKTTFLKKFSNVNTPIIFSKGKIKIPPLIGKQLYYHGQIETIFVKNHRFVYKFKGYNLHSEDIDF